jgi:glycosyltransferase involved in cell wall biosynthesis
LTIGHSYVVAQNRRLAHEMARQGRGEWEVTAAAPARLRGDLRDIELEPIAEEACTVVPLQVHLGSYPHMRLYGGKLRSLLIPPRILVHCWEEPYVLAAAQIARRLRPNTTFVPATFQNIAKRYPFPVAALERRVMSRANAWIAFGQTVYDTQRERPGYASKPARVLNPGVDTETFRPDSFARQQMRHFLGWKPDDCVVGFTGRFVEEKGIETLLQAFVQSQGDWNLLFVGGGPLAPPIESLRLQYPARVRVVRDAGHDQMPAYLRTMDILCAPSRTTARWREQFGRMLIEAMACGVPVLASASGEIPHVVQDAGQLMPENDPRLWANTIDHLVVNRAIRDELAARGLSRARTEVSWPIVARRHLDFFDEVLAQ